MDIPKQEEEYGESFSAFFQKTSFKTNQTRQKASCSKPLASFSLTSISQKVSRTQLCTEMYGVPCQQINNSKLQNKTNFQQKTEVRKGAVFCRLKTVCACYTRIVLIKYI
jgi:hypothetical protein